MTRGRARITQTEDVFELCRMDASGATPPTGPFTDYDTDATRYDPLDDIPLWLNLTDTFYFGNTNPWAVMGFLVGTIQPDHAGYTVEYYDSVGPSWLPLGTFQVDTTAGLSNEYGYWTWAIPGTWTLTTIDGASAYWIRIRSTGVTAQGRANHFLPVIEARPPVKMAPELASADQRYSPDVNNDLRKKDKIYKGPPTLKIHCTQNAFNMSEIQILQRWAENGPDLRIDDLALTNPVAWNLDAHYHYYTGKLDRIGGIMLSPHKMSPDPYSLDFLIDGAFSMFNLLGLT